MVCCLVFIGVFFWVLVFDCYVLVFEVVFWCYYVNYFVCCIQKFDCIVVFWGYGYLYLWLIVGIGQCYYWCVVGGNIEFYLCGCFYIGDQVIVEFGFVD